MTPSMVHHVTNLTPGSASPTHSASFARVSSGGTPSSHAQRSALKHSAMAAGAALAAAGPAAAATE
jgi:hypothetical protein